MSAPRETTLVLKGPTGTGMRHSAVRALREKTVLVRLPTGAAMRTYIAVRTLRRNLRDALPGIANPAAKAHFEDGIEHLTVAAKRLAAALGVEFDAEAHV